MSVYTPTPARFPPNPPPNEGSTRTQTSDAPSLIWETRHSRRRWPAAVLLAATALLYLWGLGASGYANSFYAAAVQAGTKSWKAFFFGSLDSSNFITVDKPPASLWPMELAGRLFGFNAWSMLVPQALMGVAAVGLLYVTVRRWFGPAAGLIAGSLLALTPVAALMFRYNQPDALMTLLLAVAAYGVTRAIDDGRLRWLLMAGAAMGVDFLTKSLQPFTVLPALALVYLVAAPHGFGRRLRNVLLAGVAVVAAAGWWVLVVALWPASDRPYIGGSTDNSALGLAFGYNGLGRVTGGESGPGGGFSGATGLGRLFNSMMGTQISWLIPAALIALVALFVISRGTARTDRIRAAGLLWGGWLLVTAAVLSYAGGIIHPYYTVQLAPAIAALVGVGAVVLWRRRAAVGPRLSLAAGVAVTTWWNYELLNRASSWHAELRVVLVVIGVLAAMLLVLPTRRLALVTATTGLIAMGLGSAAFAVETAATAHTGSTPSAGPAVASSGGFGGGRGGFGGFGDGAAGAGSAAPNGQAANGGQIPSGQLPDAGQLPTGGQPPSGSAAGGPGSDLTTDSALVGLLQGTSTRWAAATIGDQSAASLELASGGKAVMAIGGWSGSDPAPTLAQFQAYVASGQIRYFISGGGGFGAGRAGSSSITSWVQSHFTSRTVGNSTVYDLTSPTTSS
jgi:4-amino-4-deoxy-L-arabinose transferase-like glycosyltransferase